MHNVCHTISAVDAHPDLQAENQAKSATMEKQKGNVANAIRIQKALNPDKLKLPEFLAQSDEKQKRLDELSKLHPELQQVTLAEGCL